MGSEEIAETEQSAESAEIAQDTARARLVELERRNFLMTWTAVAQVVIGVLAIIIAAVTIWLADQSGKESSQLLRALRTDPPTKVFVYSPAAVKLKNADFAGTCELGSSLNSFRSDSARCYLDGDVGDLGRNIFDPCFAPADVVGDETVFTCPVLRKDTSITVRADLVQFVEEEGVVPTTRPAFDDINAGKPWGLRLEGGIECERISGTSGVAADSRLNFACSGPPGDRGASAGFVLGEPSRDQPIWTAYYSGSTDGPYRPLRVVRADV